MKLLVRGAGSIGHRHIANALMMGHEVYVTDPRPEAVAAAVEKGAYRIGPRAGWDAVIDATPPSARSSGLLPTLLEKPLAALAGDAREIKRTANPLSTVGYQLRFIRRLSELKAEIAAEKISYARIRFSHDLRQWRPGTDWRTSVSAQTGILLEASHELDLIRYLLGEWSWVDGCVLTTGILPGLEVEDVAIAIVGLVDGGIVELHLDMVEPLYRRTIEVVGLTKGHVLDLGEMFDSERGRNQMYVDELASFVGSVQSGQRDPRAATLEDGVAAVELADAIKTSAKSGQRVFNGSECEAAYPEHLWR